MKRFCLFISLLLSTIVMDAAGVFVVKGTASAQLNGRKIYLSSFPALDASTRLDSAIIKNGTFAFKGASSSDKLYFLLMNGKGLNFSLRAQPLIPEEGVIHVAFGEHSKISGTSLNDVYAKFDGDRSAIEKGYNLLQSLYSKLKKENRLTKAKEDSIEMEWNKLASKESCVVMDNLSTYTSTGFGAYLLFMHQNDWEASKTDSLLSKMSSSVKNQPVVASVEKQLAAKKRSMVGATYSDLVMASPEGQTMKLSDYVGKNKYVMVDFWASWCGPCRGEMPNVVAAYAKYHDKGFEIIGVSFDQQKDAWVKVLPQLKMTWPQMSDLKGWNCAAHEIYGINSIPASIIIDGNGKIVARNLRGADLDAKLAELLK